MDNYSITTILSSGLISLVISGMTILLAVGRYKQKVDHLENAKDKTHLSLNEFRVDIAALKEFKVQAQKFIDKTIYKSSSRLTLTEFGLELIKDSGLAVIFVHEQDNLATMLYKMHPKTKYDAQEMARELMDNLKEYPAFSSIKTYAYSSGKDLGQILRAGAILLRDYYLSIHPEIIN